MDLSTLTKIKKRRKKRVGRGYGSGKGGHTSGRGAKGQKSRAGYNIPKFFEGGQIPITKRLPQKRGKGNRSVRDKVSINLVSLKAIKNESVITPEVLKDLGILKKIPSVSVKILSKGDLSSKMIFRGFKYSKMAKEKIEAIGGEAL